MANLVAVNKYSQNIKELPIYKRIAIDYPMLCVDEVAQKLSCVVCELPKDIKLQVDSAYRTKRTQQILWNIRHITHPNLVHDPTKGESPHCTGAAIDISLLDKNGVEINLSEPFPKFYQEPQLISDKITKIAQELRITLNKIMLKNGFAPNPSEYWHFSYGDKIWADYYKKQQLYFETELPTKYYYRFITRIFYRIKKRVMNMLYKFTAQDINY